MADIKDLADRIARELADQGKLIEAGWQVYRLIVLKTPPNEARDDLREAFMSGAEHVFSSIIQVLEEGEEATDNDLRRVDAINNELELVRRAMKLKYGRTVGSA